ncbi:uncharacterized protein METZ01_LOCUS257362, partial [marine metagenome]
MSWPAYIQLQSVCGCTKRFILEGLDLADTNSSLLTVVVADDTFNDIYQAHTN